MMLNPQPGVNDDESAGSAPNGDPGLAEPTSPAPSDSSGDPDNGSRWPYVITATHVAFIALCAWLIITAYQGVPARVNWYDKLMLGLGFGGIGGTLNASRSIVLAVRYKRYQRRRILWQVITPLHSAVLGAVSLVVLEAGVLGITGANSDESPGPAAMGLKTERYLFFLMSFAFLVGFVSEVFVKRLRRAADALFGEQADPGLDDEGQRRAWHKTPKI